MAPNAPAVAPQMTCHLPRAVPRCLQELLVDETHQPQRLFALRCRFTVERRATDRRQLALAHDRKPWMTGVDHRLPPIQAQRSKAFAKKPDLAIQLRQLGVAVLLAGAAFLVEHLGQLLNRLALPGRNLRWMQLVLGRQLRDRLMALDRLKRHLGFELSRKPSPRSHGGSSSASMNLP